MRVCARLRVEVDCICSAVCTERQTFVLEEEHDSVELSKHQNSLGNMVSSLISLSFYTFAADTATFSLQRQYIMYGLVC